MEAQALYGGDKSLSTPNELGVDNLNVIIEIDGRRD